MSHANSPLYRYQWYSAKDRPHRYKMAQRLLTIRKFQTPAFKNFIKTIQNPLSNQISIIHYFTCICKTASVCNRVVFAWASNTNGYVQIVTGISANWK